ncbi:SDR family NAD(P)-dependent oxidoreductase [Leptolyngbya sp. NK1-12]|uniref:SDR family NAD(P)-dependent oxidoreductase n=1 Tax=Leptolyngbya sp. NK1-12 TaxID=2547451 RepID=A0AA97AMK1_9CYAN|nr:oxidoreductase [Leptolyngbya sp. NK1-12]WNZ25787.1 SDR family NAD(P)-dependent oxidoreductase [Leptolyngbya sp. NK1-12]
MKEQQVWFITGCSSGFGHALAETALEHGERVVATARNPQQLNDLVLQYGTRILALPLDVTQSFDIQAAVSQAIATFGQIDVLVNNAGYGVFGAVEEVSDADIKQQFETNVYGSLNVTRAVLPHLRRQRSGHILNISSSGGFVGFAGAGIYCASKFALEGWSEALAKEVAPLGIRVTIVEPGAFRTAFNSALVSPDQAIEDYAATSGQMLQWLDQMNGQQPGDPKRAATAILQAVHHSAPPLRLLLGADVLDVVHAKLEAVAADLAAWKDISIDTAFEGLAVSAIGG